MATESIDSGELNGTERDLLIGLNLARGRVPTNVLSRWLSISPEATVDLVESLAARGFVVETGSGVEASREVTVSPSRSALVAGQLADALASEPNAEGQAALLRAKAGDDAAAYRELGVAFHRAEERGVTAEGFELARTALEVAARSGLGERAQLGALSLYAASYLRTAGRTREAADVLDEAISKLEGAERIDALGYAAAVADDLQEPQTAERILAIAEWEALRQGEPAKAISLGSFRARALNRIGFANEADAMSHKAAGLAASSEIVSPFVELNQGWIHLDRGQVREAETRFTHLRDRTEPGDHPTIAQYEGLRARALFGMGWASDGAVAAQRALDLGAEERLVGPEFMARLALLDGYLQFGREDAALETAEAVVELVEANLPSWTNVARVGRAIALSRGGRFEEAREDLRTARAATPPGADGWRMRLRCAAVDQLITIAERGKPGEDDVDDLVDRLLQAKYYGWAAELMVAVAATRGRRGGDLAQQAAALSLQAGNPLLAARAAALVGDWSDPVFGAVIRAVKAVARRLDNEWLQHFESLPGIQKALDSPDPAIERPDEAVSSAVREALTRVGLAGDEILTPAQRRRKGLVPSRRRIGPFQIAAAAAAVIVLAGGTAVAVNVLSPEASPTTVIQQVEAEPTPTTIPSLENRQIAIGNDSGSFAGSSNPWGGPGRASVFEATGPQSVDGYYWRTTVGGAVTATPLAYGNNLLVASRDGTLYALNMTTGAIVFRLPSADGLAAAPAIGALELQESSAPTRLVVAGTDGFLRARDAVQESDTQAWSVDLGAQMTSAPIVVGEVAVAATLEGVIEAVDLGNGERLWRVPLEGSGSAPISAPLAYDSGIVYAVDESGQLSLIGLETGELVCQTSLNARVVAAPVVTGGVLYVPTEAQIMTILPAGECTGFAPNRNPQHLHDSPFEVSPAVRGDVMYAPSALFLYAIDLTDGSNWWPTEEAGEDPDSATPAVGGYATVSADSKIITSPVVAGDTVYFGTESGTVMAVDAATGEERWRWETGAIVEAAPVVLDGVVFIAAGDTIYAIGEGDLIDG